MSSPSASNVGGVETPGRRTVHSMCGMCALRCPMEVTVEDGRVTWLQGNIECTGVGSVIIDSIRNVGAGGVVCLTGVGSGGAPSGLAPADVAKALVLANNVVVGSVNANADTSTGRPRRSPPPTMRGWEG